MSVNDPSLSNRDLSPTTPEQRTWGAYNYMALWFSMSMGITTYQLASSLIANGMDWKQAISTVLLGNLIVLISDAAERACRREVRHSVSGLYSRAIRRARRQRGCDSARYRGLRVVRHTIVDRWNSDRRHAGCDMAFCCRQRRHLMGMLPRLLAAEHGHSVARGQSIRHLQAFGAPFMFIMAAGC